MKASNLTLVIPAHAPTLGSLADVKPEIKLDAIVFRFVGESVHLVTWKLVSTAINRSVNKVGDLRQRQTRYNLSGDEHCRSFGRLAWCAIYPQPVLY